MNVERENAFKDGADCWTNRLEMSVGDGRIINMFIIAWRVLTAENPNEIYTWTRPEFFGDYVGDRDVNDP